jgi:glycosyltransferase involved in cell wall biosynthesis
MARIAIVDLLFRWPPDGGARVDVREIAARLARHHEVRLFVPRHWMRLGRGRVRGDVGFAVEPVDLPLVGFDIKSTVGLLARRVSDFNPDHVWIGDGQHLKPHLTLALARFRPILRLYAYELLCGRRYGVLFRKGTRCEGIDRLDGSPQTWALCRKCMLGDARLLRNTSMMHELLAARAWRLAQRRAITESLAAASHVLVYNEEVRRRVLPFNASVHIVPSGVDCARYECVPALEAAAAAGPVHLLASGRLGDPLKGGKVLIEACDRLWARRQDFRLLVTGARTWARPYLENLGWLDADALVAAHVRCDVCIVPALWPEPFGIVAVEAMAAGRPVVASSAGGLSAIVVDGETGLLVPPGDPVALAGALERLLGDRGLVVRMGDSARARARACFDWDAIYAREYAPLFG